MKGDVQRRIKLLNIPLILLKELVANVEDRCISRHIFRLIIF